MGNFKLNGNHPPDNLPPSTNVFLPGTEQYKASVGHWLKSSSQHPLFVIQPKDPQELSSVIKLLSNPSLKDIGFAVKGGGHTGSPSFSSTSGIHIDMGLFKSISYEAPTLKVGAGCTWDEVYRYLAESNPDRNVVGGERGIRGVGVSGYLLGSGFSVKTGQYGLGIDGIRSIEVVLPDGRIKSVDKDTDKDLFWALKGGGNNFGIVTQFTLETHEQGKVYGGKLFFGPRFIDIKEATNAYIANDNNAKTAVLTTFIYSLPEGSSIPVASSDVDCFYDGPTPVTNPFKPFLDQNPSGRITETDWHLGDIDPGGGTRGRVASIMISKYRPELLDKLTEELALASEKMLENGGLLLMARVVLFHRDMFNSSPPAAYPHQKGYPYTPLPFIFKWEGAQHDEFWLGEMKGILQRLRKAALELGCTSNTAPADPNHSLAETPLSAIYGKNLERLVELRQEYDPHRVMDRTGGFRI